MAFIEGDPLGFEQNLDGRVAVSGSRSWIAQVSKSLMKLGNWSCRVENAECYLKTEQVMWAQSSYEQMTAG
jgi:hypothetical protein